MSKLNTFCARHSVHLGPGEVSCGLCSDDEKDTLRLALKSARAVLEAIKFEDENANNLTSYSRDLVLDWLKANPK